MTEDGRQWDISGNALRAFLEDPFGGMEEGPPGSSGQGEHSSEEEEEEEEYTTDNTSSSDGESDRDLDDEDLQGVFAQIARLNGENPSGDADAPKEDQTNKSTSNNEKEPSPHSSRLGDGTPVTKSTFEEVPKQPSIWRKAGERMKRVLLFKIRMRVIPFIVMAIIVALIGVITLFPAVYALSLHSGRLLFPSYISKYSTTISSHLSVGVQDTDNVSNTSSEMGETPSMSNRTVRSEKEHGPLININPQSSNSNGGSLTKRPPIHIEVLNNEVSEFSLFKAHPSDADTIEWKAVRPKGDRQGFTNVFSVPLKADKLSISGVLRTTRIEIEETMENGLNLDGSFQFLDNNPGLTASTGNLLRVVQDTTDRASFRILDSDIHVQRGTSGSGLLTGSEDGTMSINNGQLRINSVNKTVDTPNNLSAMGVQIGTLIIGEPECSTSPCPLYLESSDTGNPFVFDVDSLITKSQARLEGTAKVGDDLLIQFNPTSNVCEFIKSGTSDSTLKVVSSTGNNTIGKDVGVQFNNIIYAHSSNGRNIIEVPTDKTTNGSDAKSPMLQLVSEKKEHFTLDSPTLTTKKIELDGTFFMCGTNIDGQVEGTIVSSRQDSVFADTKVDKDSTVNVFRFDLKNLTIVNPDSSSGANVPPLLDVEEDFIMEGVLKFSHNAAAELSIQATGIKFKDELNLLPSSLNGGKTILSGGSINLDSVRFGQEGAVFIRGGALEGKESTRLSVGSKLIIKPDSGDNCGISILDGELEFLSSIETASDGKETSVFEISVEGKEHSAFFVNGTVVSEELFVPISEEAKDNPEGSNFIGGLRYYEQETSGESCVGLDSGEDNTNIELGGDEEETGIFASHLTIAKLLINNKEAIADSQVTSKNPENPLKIISDGTTTLEQGISWRESKDLTPYRHIISNVGNPNMVDVQLSPCGSNEECTPEEYVLKANESVVVSTISGSRFRANKQETKDNPLTLDFGDKLVISSEKYMTSEYVNGVYVAPFMGIGSSKKGTARGLQKYHTLIYPDRVSSVVGEMVFDGGDIVFDNSFNLKFVEDFQLAGSFGKGTLPSYVEKNKDTIIEEMKRLDEQFGTNLATFATNPQQIMKILDPSLCTSSLSTTDICDNTLMRKTKESLRSSVFYSYAKEIKAKHKIGKLLLYELNPITTPPTGGLNKLYAELSFGSFVVADGYSMKVTTKTNGEQDFKGIVAIQGDLTTTKLTVGKLGVGEENVVFEGDTVLLSSKTFGFNKGVGKSVHLSKPEGGSDSATLSFEMKESGDNGGVACRSITFDESGVMSSSGDTNLAEGVEGCYISTSTLYLANSSRLAIANFDLQTHTSTNSLGFSISDRSVEEGQTKLSFDVMTNIVVDNDDNDLAIAVVTSPIADGQENKLHQLNFSRSEGQEAAHLNLQEWDGVGHYKSFEETNVKIPLFAESLLDGTMATVHIVSPSTSEMQRIVDEFTVMDSVIEGVDLNCSQIMFDTFGFRPNAADLKPSMKVSYIGAEASPIEMKELVVKKKAIARDGGTIGGISFSDSEMASKQDGETLRFRAPVLAKGNLSVAFNNNQELKLEANTMTARSTKDFMIHKAAFKDISIKSNVGGDKTQTKPVINITGQTNTPKEDEEDAFSFSYNRNYKLDNGDSAQLIYSNIGHVKIHEDIVVPNRDYKFPQKEFFVIGGDEYHGDILKGEFYECKAVVFNGTAIIEGSLTTSISSDASTVFEGTKFLENWLIYDPTNNAAVTIGEEDLLYLNIRSNLEFKGNTNIVTRSLSFSNNISISRKTTTEDGKQTKEYGDKNTLLNDGLLSSSFGFDMEKKSLDIMCGKVSGNSLLVVGGVASENIDINTGLIFKSNPGDRGKRLDIKGNKVSINQLEPGSTRIVEFNGLRFQGGVCGYFDGGELRNWNVKILGGDMKLIGTIQVEDVSISGLSGSMLTVKGGADKPFAVDIEEDNNTVTLTTSRFIAGTNTQDEPSLLNESLVTTQLEVGPLVITNDSILFGDEVADARQLNIETNNGELQLSKIVCSKLLLTDSSGNSFETIDTFTSTSSRATTMANVKLDQLDFTLKAESLVFGDRFAIEEREVNGQGFIEWVSLYDTGREEEEQSQDRMSFGTHEHGMIQLSGTDIGLLSGTSMTDNKTLGSLIKVSPDQEEERKSYSLMLNGSHPQFSTTSKTLMGKGWFLATDIQSLRDLLAQEENQVVDNGKYNFDSYNLTHEQIETLKGIVGGDVIAMGHILTYTDPNSTFCVGNQFKEIEGEESLVVDGATTKSAIVGDSLEITANKFLFNKNNDPTKGIFSIRTTSGVVVNGKLTMDNVPLQIFKRGSVEDSGPVLQILSNTIKTSSFPNTVTHELMIQQQNDIDGHIGFEEKSGQYLDVGGIDYHPTDGVQFSYGSVDMEKLLFFDGTRFGSISGHKLFTPNLVVSENSVWVGSYLVKDINDTTSNPKIHFGDITFKQGKDKLVLETKKEGDENTSVKINAKQITLDKLSTNGKVDVNSLTLYAKEFIFTEAEKDTHTPTGCEHSLLSPEGLYVRNNFSGAVDLNVLEVATPILMYDGSDNIHSIQHAGTIFTMNDNNELLVQPQTPNNEGDDILQIVSGEERTAGKVSVSIGGNSIQFDGATLYSSETSRDVSGYEYTLLSTHPVKDYFSFKSFTGEIKSGETKMWGDIESEEIEPAEQFVVIEGDVSERPPDTMTHVQLMKHKEGANMEITIGDKSLFVDSMEMSEEETDDLEEMETYYGLSGEVHLSTLGLSNTDILGRYTIGDSISVSSLTDQTVTLNNIVAEEIEGNLEIEELSVSSLSFKEDADGDGLTPATPIMFTEGLGFSLVSKWLDGIEPIYKVNTSKLLLEMEEIECESLFFGNWDIVDVTEDAEGNSLVSIFDPNNIKGNVKNEPPAAQKPFSINFHDSEPFGSIKENKVKLVGEGESLELSKSCEMKSTAETFVVTAGDIIGDVQANWFSTVVLDTIAVPEGGTGEVKLKGNSITVPKMVQMKGGEITIDEDGMSFLNILSLPIGDIMITAEQSLERVTLSCATTQQVDQVNRIIIDSKHKLDLSSLKAAKAVVDSLTVSDLVSRTDHELWSSGSVYKFNLKSISSTSSLKTSKVSGILNFNGAKLVIGKDVCDLQDNTCITLSDVGLASSDKISVANEVRLDPFVLHRSSTDGLAIEIKAVEGETSSSSLARLKGSGSINNLQLRGSQLKTTNNSPKIIKAKGGTGNSFITVDGRVVKCNKTQVEIEADTLNLNSLGASRLSSQPSSPAHFCVNTQSNMSFLFDVIGPGKYKFLNLDNTVGDGLCETPWNPSSTDLNGISEKAALRLSAVYVWDDGKEGNDHLKESLYIDTEIGALLVGTGDSEGLKVRLTADGLHDESTTEEPRTIAIVSDDVGVKLAYQNTVMVESTEIFTGCSGSNAKVEPGFVDKVTLDPIMKGKLESLTIENTSEYVGSIMLSQLSINIPSVPPEPNLRLEGANWKMNITRATHILDATTDKLTFTLTSTIEPTTSYMIHIGFTLKCKDTSLCENYESSTVFAGQTFAYNADGFKVNDIAEFVDGGETITVKRTSENEITVTTSLNLPAVLSAKWQVTAELLALNLIFGTQGPL